MLVKQRNNTEYTAWYFNLADTTFDACQHGSLFAKTTRLKGTPGIFDHLAGRRSGDHENAKWHVQKLNSSWVSNTAAEAEHPKLLAQRRVDAFAVQLPSGLLDFTRRQFRPDLLQQADKQHCLAQQLIPEYREILYVDAPPHDGGIQNFVCAFNCGGQLQRPNCGNKAQNWVLFFTGRALGQGHSTETPCNGVQRGTRRAEGQFLQAMHFGASCNGSNENLCAEGCHEVEA